MSRLSIWSFANTERHRTQDTKDTRHGVQGQEPLPPGAGYPRGAPGSSSRLRGASMQFERAVLGDVEDSYKKIHERWRVSHGDVITFERNSRVAFTPLRKSIREARV